MADDPLIVRALDKISANEAENTRLRIFINEADKLNGREPRFPDVGSATGSTSAVASQVTSKRWQAGEFFNKPLAGVVRTILLARAEAAGGPSPASVDEIYDALTQGTFNFETSGADAQKNGVRISLGKNSTTFVKLPNTDLFGLVEWYGKRPGKPGRKASNGEPTPSAGTGEAEEGSDEVAPDDNEARAAA